MLASITIWNSGSINRELIQSSAQESVHLVICMILKALCPMTGNSFSRHKLWHSRDKLWIILTIPPVIKIRYIGQCVKIPVYLCYSFISMSILFL